MDQRVDHRLPNHFVGVGPPLHPPGPVLQPGRDPGVAPHEAHRLLHQPRLGQLPGPGQQRRHRPPQPGPLDRGVVLLGAGQGQRVDPGLGQEPVGVLPEQQHPRHRRRAPGRHLGQLQQVLPRRPVVALGDLLLAHPPEVVPQPPCVQALEARPRQRPRLHAQRPPLLEQPGQLLARQLPALRPDPPVVGAPVVVPQALRLRAPQHPDAGHVPALLDVSHHLEERHDAGPDLVPAGGHHPLLEPVAGDPRDAAVVLDAQQHHPPVEAGEGHQLLGQVVVGDAVALELDAGVLAVADDLEELVACGHVNPRSRQRRSRRHRLGFAARPGVRKGSELV